MQITCPNRGNTTTSSGDSVTRAVFWALQNNLFTCRYAHTRVSGDWCFRPYPSCKAPQMVWICNVCSFYIPSPTPSGKRRSFHSRWRYSYSNSEGRKRVDYLSGKTFSGGLNLHLGFSVVFSFICLRVIEHTCQFLKRGLDQPHSVLGCCGMGAEVDDRGRRERWRESGTRDLSREIVFPWMHRWWNWAVFGHSSQTRRPKKRGALGMVYYLRQLLLWSERPTLLHALLYEEGRRYNARWSPFSRPFFCPSRYYASKDVSQRHRRQ